MKKMHSELLFKNFIEKYRQKLDPDWQKLIVFSLEEKNKFLFFEYLVNSHIGSAFQIKTDQTKNGHLVWADNRYTMSLKTPVCFYLPFDDSNFLFNRQQEYCFFWGILLALKAIQWARDFSCCRVSWILERRKTKRSSASISALQRLSLKGKKSSGLVFEKIIENHCQKETWASRFLDPTEPELILSSETETAQSFNQDGHKMLGCHFRDTPYMTEKQDILCHSKAERIGSFLIKMLSCLDRE